jgi:hypothetical protein
VTKCERSGIKKPTIVLHPKLGCDCEKVCTRLVDENPSSTGSVLAVGSIRKIRLVVREYSGSESC